MRRGVTVGQTRWTPDGTQAPTPPPVFEDPLAGLVTGAKAGADITGDPYDNMVVPVATPVELDDDASRAIMAVLDDDGPQPEGRPVPLPLPPPSDLSAGVVPGMVAEPERRPARLRVRQALGGYPKDAAKRRQQLGDRRQELMAA
ncbi:MAG: hypothetical protein ACRDQF_07225, partial [Thermocrispum sp.]